MMWLFLAGVLSAYGVFVNLSRSMPRWQAAVAVAVAITLVAVFCAWLARDVHKTLDDLPPRDDE